jgi:hypothetical protein
MFEQNKKKKGRRKSGKAEDGKWAEEGEGVQKRHSPFPLVNLRGILPQPTGMADFLQIQREF